MRAERTAREEYFARVEPLLGEGLRRHAVSFEQLSLTGRVLELLAGCRLGRARVVEPAERPAWPLTGLLRGPPGEASGSASARLRRYLRWKNAFEPVRLSPGRGPADARVAARLLPEGESPYLDWTPESGVTLGVAPYDRWSHLNLCAAAARGLRDALLGRAAWPSGRVYLGSRDWPFAESRRPLAPPVSGPAPGPRHLMVIGCGSVGSELLRLLAGPQVRWTLVDGASVSPYNPYRQWFGCREIGRPKVDCLAERLRPAPVRALTRRLDGSSDGAAALAELVRTDRPDAVVLATGTADAAGLAEVLWRARVPHLAACAYPRARFFELALVAPGEATPCLHCFRGHLYRGPEAEVPMTDELAAFLYRDIDPAERERLWTDLVAEPATPIETGRLAAVAAQALVELCAPSDRRSAWFTRLLVEGTTCLLGANEVESLPGGDFAYGLERPGQVIRLGLPDVAGAAERVQCQVCGRRLMVVHRQELPQAEEEALDQAWSDSFGASSSSGAYGPKT